MSDDVGRKALNEAAQEILEVSLGNKVGAQEVAIEFLEKITGHVSASPNKSYSSHTRHGSGVWTTPPRKESLFSYKSQRSDT